jgi:hypothetical protein
MPPLLTHAAFRHFRGIQGSPHGPEKPYPCSSQEQEEAPSLHSGSPPATPTARYSALSTSEQAAGHPVQARTAAVLPYRYLTESCSASECL